MFKEICNLIEDRTGFVKGSTLQVAHRLSTAPDRCILVQESGGGEANPYCADMVNPLIQVTSRAKTYFQARADAWTVYKAFHPTFGWNMENVEGGEDYLAMSVTALAIPQYIGQDENKRFEFSVNFIFRIEEASCG